MFFPRRRGEKKTGPPPASGKTLESPVSSVFSFSALPGGVHRLKAPSLSSSSKSKCLPSNYVMIGGQASAARGFTPTWSPSTLSFPLPRIAVAGAKPAFFAPRAIGEESVGENLTLGEILKWKEKSIDRKVAISWQSSGLVESKPKADWLPSQVLAYALSRRHPSHQSALHVKPKPIVGMKDNRVPVSYIIASDKLEAGKTVMNCDWSRPEQSTALSRPSENAVAHRKLQEFSYEKLDLSLQVGNCLPLADMRMGTWVHDIEWRPGQGAKLARAAGTYAKIIKEQGSQCLVRLPSGVERLIDSRCRATVGMVSNPDHDARKLRKAGQNRWLGWRPVVRGVAMNPIDHPHGGGEGRTKGGRPSVSPWGKPTKGGFKTVLKAVSKGRL